MKNASSSSVSSVRHMHSRQNPMQLFVLPPSGSPAHAHIPFAVHTPADLADPHVGV
jgi:hypothetical protein